jgi:UDP-N-acetylmuramate--alanine ligase
LRRNGLCSEFQVQRPGRPPLPITLNLPGRHNILNSLAAIAIASELAVADEAIQNALASFQGVDRRLQRVGRIEFEAGYAEVIDDYGHHPTEIHATLDAVRQIHPEARIVLAFQPHRYSRTRDLIDDFARVLTEADVVLVTEVYAAGETPIAGADGRAICRAIRSQGRIEPVFVPDVERLSDALSRVVRPGDVVLAMGAGNISQVAHGLSAVLSVPKAANGGGV